MGLIADDSYGSNGQDMEPIELTKAARGEMEAIMKELDAIIKELSA